MQIIQISGNEKKIELEGLDRPQFLTFRNISVNATIRVVIERVGAQNNDKIFAPISVATLLETQKKIQRLEAQNILTVTKFGATKDTVDSEELPVPGAPFISVASLQIAIGGEIGLGNNDKAVIYLTGLDDLPCSMIVKGGKTISTQYYKVMDEIFEANHREKPLDVADYSYLVFKNDALQFPEKIEKVFMSHDKETETFETVLADAESLYGLIAVDGSEQHFGTKDAIVVDVRGVKTITLYNEVNQVINFYGVKFN